jgi:hypothetical protein
MEAELMARAEKGGKPLVAWEAFVVDPKTDCDAPLQFRSCVP